MRIPTSRSLLLLFCIRVTLIEAVPTDLRDDESLRKMHHAPVLLYAPAHHEPAPLQAWNVDHFVNVDDTVRGGQSRSRVTLTPHNGDLEFSGHLDITALGGAGFASQANDHPFPTSLSREVFDGLRLHIRKPSAASALGRGARADNVTLFNFNIKTELPKTRPDGRRESGVVWEWSFQLPCSELKQSDDLKASLPYKEDSEFWMFEAKWDDFKPTYRGRPAENPGEFRPQETKEWSLMARSNFGLQQGDFSLQVHTLSAFRTPSSLSKRDLIADSEKLGLLSSFTGNGDATTPLGAARARAPSSGEYYGFALFIFATVLLVVWILWALTPDWALQKIGVAWYPNREWAYLIPAWSLIGVLGIYAGFISLNLYNTPDLEDVHVVIDSHSNLVDVPLDSAEAKHPLEGYTAVETGRGTAPLANDVYDLAPGMVSRELYLSHSSSPL